MVKQVINVGTSENDNTGDSLRAAGGKINSNFTELYNVLGGENNQQLTLVSQLTTNDGLSVSSPTGVIELNLLPATANSIGGIIPGSGITVNNAGVASVQVYSLPKASVSILGGVKVGDRLSIDANGVLSADPGAYSLPTATTSLLGGVKVDGTSITIAGGVISAQTYTLPVATGSVLGGVKIGSRLTITNGVLSADVQTIGSTPILTAGAYNLTLESTGRVKLPNQGVKIVDPATVTVPNGTSTVVYSTGSENVRAIKMTIFAEKFVNGYESQVCELLGIINNVAKSINSSSFNEVYTGTNPMFSLSTRYNIQSQSYEVLLTPDSTDTVKVRSVVTEIYGTES